MLTLSHINCERTLADLTTSKGHVNGVLALLGGFVGAAIAAVTLVLNGARHRVLIPCRVHDHHFHLSNTSTLEKQEETQLNTPCGLMLQLAAQTYITCCVHIKVSGLVSNIS